MESGLKQGCECSNCFLFVLHFDAFWTFSLLWNINWKEDSQSKHISNMFPLTRLMCSIFKPICVIKSGQILEETASIKKRLKGEGLETFKS